MAVATQSTPTRAFPKSQVQKVLADWWDEKLNSALSKRRSPEEIRKSGGTVFEIQPELSSNQAVPILLELEEVLGYEPDKKVIRRGGYRGRDEFLTDLTMRLEAEYAERNPSLVGEPQSA